MPGADGIPKHVCVPDPRHHDCKMNGFIKEAEVKLCKPKPAPCHTDVMGYHVESDIPNYWAFAKNFVLQDHMFEAAGSWSLPDHLYESPAGRPPAPRPATR